MKVRLDPSSLKRIQWYEYAVRFAFGGTITVLTGLIGSKFGPTIGGMFMAFPAILPASVTLVEKHNNKDAAGANTLGAALGSIGLLGFAVAVWMLAERLPAWKVLAIATVIWVVISTTLWVVLEQLVESKV